MKIGYIGLGSQGSGMAEMIARSEHDLAVWARRPGVVDPYLALGAMEAASPADLASQCDIVGTCVMADVDVLGLARDQGMLAAMKPGSVFVNQATISPQTSLLLGELGSKHGVLIVDAPVSGSSAAALTKNLLVLASGADEAIHAARPMFDTYGKVVHCGGLGASQVAKIINNALYYSNSQLVHQAHVLAASLGLTSDGLDSVLETGSGGSFAAGVHASMFDPRAAGHIAQLCAKDVELFKALPGYDPALCLDLQAVAEHLVTSMTELARQASVPNPE